MRGVLLEGLTWEQAESALTAASVVVLPLGAAAKQHGPHLKLNNDLVMAQYLAGRVAEASDVIIAPPVTYHFYPAFLEYPGSTSLRLETARDLVVDVCLTLSSYGPRRFYVLNTGVSTVRALKPAVEALAAQRVLLRYSDITALTAEAESAVSEQEGGTHADEIETSMMLYICPSCVDMGRAVKEYNPAPGGLTRSSDGAGAFSASGVYGDATLASRDKGEAVVEALVDGILRDIEALRLAEPLAPA